jgi:hypothetical protein
MEGKKTEMKKKFKGRDEQSMTPDNDAREK